MAASKVTVFRGIFPRTPEHLLPEAAATIAQNCDFAYGELRNVKGGFKVNASPMVNAPASIYTDDGLTFYTWPTDVDAVRSPIVNDTFNRLYWTTGTDMMVGPRTSQSLTGGLPPSPYRVGVPRPTQAPKMKIILPDVTDSAKYTYKFTFHYEYAGVKYQETDVSPTPQVANQQFNNKWDVTIPGKSREVSHGSQSEFPETGDANVIYYASDEDKRYKWQNNAYVVTTQAATPDEAFPAMRMVCNLKFDNSTMFDIYSSNSSFATSGYDLFMVGTSTQNVYTLSLEVGPDQSEIETRAYVYTYVNTYNEEGPPSPPGTIDATPVIDIEMTLKLDAVTGYAPIKEVRVYRTASGSALPEYYYVGSKVVLALQPGEFIQYDSVRAAQLNEPLSSLNNYPPPSGLTGLMSLPNGILAAWKDNELWFADAYRPWAWNPANVKPLPNVVVGGVVYGSGALITTRGNPYIVSGVSSDSMTTAKINVDQAGVSKWSIAVVDGSVVYASNDGIVTVNGGQATLVPSQRFFTRETWRNLYGQHLSAMRFSVWDGRLIVFGGGNQFTPFLMRFDEDGGSMSELPLFVAQSAFVSQLSDQAYYANGTAIYQFAGGADIEATWQSKQVRLDRPLNFAFAQAIVTGTWEIKFFADGVLRRTKTVTTGVQNFRLPGGFKSDTWQIRIKGTGQFKELRMAESAIELARV